MTELFEIEEIGAELAPTAGLPDACDLCGHCRVLRLMAQRGHRVAAGCGGRRAAGGESPEPLNPFPDRFAPR